MYKNVFLNVAVVVMFAAMLGIGYVMICALDRLHEDNVKIMDKISRLEAAPGFAGRSPVMAEPKESAAAGEKIANAEFFDPAAQPGGRMIRTIQSDTGNLNSLLNNDATASTFHGLTDSTLAELNYRNTTEFEPLMAESWTISPDKKIYTIKLRKGILWHDFTDPVTGKRWENVEVTAHDFKFYVDAINNPDTNCGPLRTYYKQLDKIEVINDYEFKVYWKTRYFQSKIFTLGMSPLPRHLYHAYEGPFDGKNFNDDHQRNRIIIGCGPYRFLRWDKGQRVVFTAWEKYFGRKYGIMPPIRDIGFDVISHPNTMFQALLSGKIDNMNLLPEQWITRTGIKEFAPGAQLAKYRYPGRLYSYIGYNLGNELFKDKIVRQALSHLVNREKILKDIYHGLGRIVTGPFFVDSCYYDRSVKPYEFSVEQAKKLLNRAGWRDTDGDGILDRNGKKFEFTMMQISGSTTQAKMLPMIQQDMAKAGIIMNIQAFEWSVYLKRIEMKNFEVCCLAWTSPLEPDPYQVWHSSGADKPHSSNHIGFKNRRADELIDRLRVTFDMDERVRLAHEFHRLLHDEQPYTFLISPDALMALSSRYRNVRRFPLGYPESIMWVPKNEQLKIPGM